MGKAICQVCTTQHWVGTENSKLVIYQGREGVRACIAKGAPIAEAQRNNVVQEPTPIERYRFAPTLAASRR